MSLVVNNNLMAGNVARNLNTHYARLSTSTQRLSSGLRVNSAADDAAGLAIRELMRADISALHQGARNANDAISMIQVADGALSIIDEKLIRMKELAEQAATGTYDSTQRLMIDSEFQAMGAEIDRIANATDFNGIKLLDGSLAGAHDGSGLTSKGAMKIHFGTANDSAEDYYYVDIADCTLKGLGLVPGIYDLEDPEDAITLKRDKDNPLPTWKDLNLQEGQWYYTGEDCNFKFVIPRGTKDVMINMLSGWGLEPAGVGSASDNDIQLFTKNGVHLAGTLLNPNNPYDPNADGVFGEIYLTNDFVEQSCSLADNAPIMGFTVADYNNANLNTGYTTGGFAHGQMLGTSYNGMLIGYTGDSEFLDSNPNNMKAEDTPGYELLYIDEVKEDLVVWFPGVGGCWFKVFGGPDGSVDIPFNQPAGSHAYSIRTQAGAQATLVRIDNAIVKKDQIRAHLGALQNRLENTVSNLNIQAENLLASESRISDVDVATEMTQFVRNQILTQSAVAMLGQANSMPQMAMQLIGG